VVASARKVRNELPEGATWDGTTGLLVDEKQFAEMIGAREPAATTTAPAAAPPPATATSPQTSPPGPVRH